MRPGSLLRWLGLTVSVFGLGAVLVMTLGGCGAGGDEVHQAGAPEVGQVIAQPAPPPLDTEAPQAFQTASFAFG